VMSSFSCSFPYSSWTECFKHIHVMSSFSRTFLYSS
jgi:hypothetical protein